MIPGHLNLAQTIALELVLLITRRATGLKVVFSHDVIIQD